MNQQQVLSVDEENYGRVIMEEDQKDVVLMLGSEMCGSCKEFKPTFYKVAEQLLHNENLKITTINVDKFVPNFDFTEVPSIFVFKAGESKQDFKTCRTKQNVAEIIACIYLNTKNKLTINQKEVHDQVKNLLKEKFQSEWQESKQEL